MFGSLKSLKACTTHISHWLICHEIRNEEGVNVPCLSVLGLFVFLFLVDARAVGEEHRLQIVRKTSHNGE